MVKIEADSLHLELKNYITGQEEDFPKVIMLNADNSNLYKRLLTSIPFLIENFGWNHISSSIDVDLKDSMLEPIFKIFREIFYVPEEILKSNAGAPDDQKLKQVGRFLIPGVFQTLEFIDEIFLSINEPTNPDSITKIEFFDLPNLFDSLVKMAQLIGSVIYNNEGLVFILNDFHFADKTTLSWLKHMLESNVKIPIVFFLIHKRDLITHKDAFAFLKNNENYPNKLTVLNIYSDLIDNEESNEESNDGQTTSGLEPIDFSVSKKNIAKLKLKTIEGDNQIVVPIEEVIAKEEQKKKDSLPFMLFQSAKTQEDSQLVNNFLVPSGNTTTDSSKEADSDSPKITSDAHRLTKESEALFDFVKKKQSSEKTE
jgi:hypothetical protein